jgi:hypothetical protein
MRPFLQCLARRVQHSHLPQLSGSKQQFAVIIPGIGSERGFSTIHASTTIGSHSLAPTLINQSFCYKRHNTDFAKQARDLNQKALDDQESQLEDAIEQEKTKQVRAPWHREGTDQAPVKRQRSAGAMTKGLSFVLLVRDM